jgi:hypothetical protein
MLNSNLRKLALSGWLRQHGQAEYGSALRLQKFLFFYEAMAKVDGVTADFYGLKGYQRGPVFSQVWGDRQHENSLFSESASEAYRKNPSLVNDERASICHFIVSVFSEEELSDITHSMNIWSCKRDDIMSGAYNVELDERDFNENDVSITQQLKDAFPLSMVENSIVVALGRNSFIIPKEDEAKISEQHYDALFAISQSGQVENPVYASIDENGAIVVD